MPNLFEYLDYRKYLADYYEERRKANPHFSYAVLSNQLGFKSRDFIHRVIHGKKNLSTQSTAQISQGLKHAERQAQYFSLLVQFNQAKGIKDKSFYYNFLTSLRPTSSTDVKVQRVRKNQYRFYSRWYHSVIRSLIDLGGFDGDYQGLARLIMPPITARQARQSVRLLERLEMIKRGIDGKYITESKIISTGPEARDVAISNFHLATTSLAGRALDICPREERDMSSLTLGISAKAFTMLKERLAEFRKEIMKIAEEDADADRVFQLNLHLFPLSRPIMKEKV